MAAVQTEARRRPGRPRDEELEQLVLDAALDLIDSEQEITVSKLVELSGVSRAAIYRRWPSMTLLIASALNIGRVVQPAINVDGDLRQNIFDSLYGRSLEQAAQMYSESRFRHRIRLVMADRELQRTYWESHVKRRRIPVEDALREAVSRGMLRRDLDVEACFDTLAGVAYYQLVVRGEAIRLPETRARLEAAFETVWRGMILAS
ncbi:transcriptional regulator [Glutamicibacter halophytocola]|uniref:TetR-like C-terminal domain-containing protein n=1 Tax=Glutamicibacter halophytocola TaxID=1933880 RepID=UPI0006D4B883|nr:TetR-like C-terminal domain-containing protein [Glutamicibacter halophytocola]ALG30332.1 transcriptional regulator [Glutamicibacter halophytocola]